LAADFEPIQSDLAILLDGLPENVVVELLKRFLWFFLTNPDSAALDNPKFAIEFFARESVDERLAETFEFTMRCGLERAQDGNATILRWPEQQWVPKIQIEGYDGTPLVTASFGSIQSRRRRPFADPTRWPRHGLPPGTGAPDVSQDFRQA